MYSSYLACISITLGELPKLPYKSLHAALILFILAQRSCRKTQKGRRKRADKLVVHVLQEGLWNGSSWRRATEGVALTSSIILPYFKHNAPPLLSDQTIYIGVKAGSRINRQIVLPALLHLIPFWLRLWRRWPNVGYLLVRTLADVRRER